MHTQSVNTDPQSAARLIDHLFNQAALKKVMPTDEGGAHDRLARAMEAITQLGEGFMQREARIKDLEREARSLESQLIISEKEKLIIQ